MKHWGTPEQLRALLCELVSWKSMTLTEGELSFPVKVYEKLTLVPYFRDNPSHLQLGSADLGRQFLTALYKHEHATKTVVLISHFDTVNTEEYGELEGLAFDPETLTVELEKYINELPIEAQNDLRSGQYLWGRGTMDMKAGLANHMAIIEKAADEAWPINIVLLTVPDEEVNSSGMRSAVKALNDMQKEHGLTFALFLNGEPVFSQNPSDTTYNVYSGSIGKLMPSALIYGKETHVGEPMGGITAPFIASFLTQRMEFNPLFRETDFGETTPLPVTLQQKDLKMEYSVQTPYRASALYNVFVMKQTASDIMDLFEQIALEAATECNRVYQDFCIREKTASVGHLRVLRFSELLSHATKKFGSEYIESVKNKVAAKDEWDDREKSIRIADTLLLNCQELTPAIVLLFTPPYYPAVNSSEDALVTSCIEKVAKIAHEQFALPVNQVHYFNGLSDLSYVNYQDTSKGWEAFEQNTPVWGTTYTIPFEGMKQLKAPVMNVGPFGKDPHKRTERLHIENAFIITPKLIEEVIKQVARFQSESNHKQEMKI